MNNEKELRHRYGWTPASTKPAYSQTNVSLAHKGRDYDAILRAAKRKPVGYWEDAPAGIKFGKQNTGVGSGSCPTTDATASKQGVAPLASTPSSTPAPQQSADDQWPKCLMHHEGGYEFLDVYALDAGGLQYHKNDPHAYRCSEPYSTRIGKETVEAVSQAEAAQWLEQNGHKDAAAQLRGKEEFEPVGTVPVAGDVMRNEDGRTYTCTGVHGEDGRKFGSTDYSKSALSGWCGGSHDHAKQNPTSKP